MYFLRELLEEAEVQDLTSKAEKGTVLPQGTIDQLKKLITQGAKPNKEGGFENWSNSLHLVHKSFQVSGIQRPTPDMKDLWKQYEELIGHAVKELSKYRGIDGGWRMSSSSLHDK